MKRSTEAPMDFEFTNRPQTKGVWATTPQKRSHADVAPSSTSTFGFGANQNVPFIFHSPAPPPAPLPTHPWVPANFSPEKAFPQPPEPKDVDMREASPPKPSTQESAGRKVATGGLRRVFRSRMQAKAKSKALVPVAADENLNESGSEDSADEGRALRRTESSMSNHYTLNMAAPAPPPSDMPYILLGYLQFFFNLSLVILFLYLVIQFIWTVQRDVQERISEYSMDIIQDIALCRRHHENNLCNTPLPAMAAQCAQWALCMARDPAVVGRARVGAELIAEVVNGFVEPISWKTLGFTLTSLAFLTLFINTLLLVVPRASTAKSAIDADDGVTPYHPAHTPSWADRRNWEQQQDVGTPTRARRRRVEGGGALKVR
ncbi:Di-sulfide bridge nucleocytoplasmic transport domain-containing protein [Mycena amicta]|nr:Di-sulfide bridge nucleocytoplasmic transport domain-containing protein [Mycena amicta]